MNKIPIIDKEQEDCKLTKLLKHREFLIRFAGTQKYFVGLFILMSVGCSCLIFGLLLNEPNNASNEELMNIYVCMLGFVMALIFVGGTYISKILIILIDIVFEKNNAEKSI